MPQLNSQAQPNNAGDLKGCSGKRGGSRLSRSPNPPEPPSAAVPLPVHCAFSCHLGWTPKPTPLFDQEAPVCNRLCSQSHRQTWSAQTKATKTNTTTTRKSDVVKVELKMSCPASPPKPAPPLIPDLNKWHHHSPRCSFLFSRGCS